jgi:hypothetical protein
MPKLTIRKHDANDSAPSSSVCAPSAAGPGDERNSPARTGKRCNMPILETLFEMADMFNIAASEIVRELEQGRQPGG